MAWLLRLLSLTVLLAMTLPQAAWLWAGAECCAGAPCDDAEDEDEGCPPSCDHCVSGPHAPRLAATPLESVVAPLMGLEVEAAWLLVVTPPNPPASNVFHPPRDA